MMIRVDVHPKCVHFGLGLESYCLGLSLDLESYGLGLGLGLATAGLDYIPGILVHCSK